jgi:hypothetical protein
MKNNILANRRHLAVQLESPGVPDAAGDSTTPLQESGVKGNAVVEPPSTEAHPAPTELPRLPDAATRSDFDEDESLRKQCVEIIRSERMAKDFRFAALLVATMDEWLKGPEMASINQRARIVHGAAFAAFKALAELLGSHAPSDTARFKDYLLRHCTEAVGLVRDRVNVNLFWRDLLDALCSPLHPFGEGPDLLKLFHLTAVIPAACPVTEHQLKAGAESSAYAWTSWELAFLPRPVIKILRAHKRRGGRELPLDQPDLRAQMQVRPYWKPEPTTRGHRKKFGKSSRTSQKCWVVLVDQHELGLQPVADAEFQESLYAEGGSAQGVFLTGDEWVDPRKGDLFALIDLLVKAKEKTTRGGKPV